MCARLVDYTHFLGIASRLEWDERRIELGDDARAWPGLEPARRERVTAFVAGFALAEERVAVDLAPFAAAAPSAAMAECFAAQARDEERHASFFDRYAREVLAVAGDTPGARLDWLRRRVEPRFAELFEERLHSVATSLADGALPLGDAVTLYHLVLEGVVFSAAQNALLAELEADAALPGLAEGLRRVVLDERWHIGFGVRVLRGGAAPGAGAEADAERAVRAWGNLLGPEQREAALRQHRRRLTAAGLA